MSLEIFEMSLEVKMEIMLKCKLSLEIDFRLKCHLEFVFNLMFTQVRFLIKMSLKID